MGTSGQRIQLLFYYTRYRNLGQSVFALQYENFQLRPRVPRVIFPAAAEQKQAQKSAHHLGKTLCLFTCSGRSISSVREQDGKPLHGQSGCLEGRVPLALGFQ